MTKKEVIDYVKKSDFWLAEGPATFNMCYPWIIGTPNTREYFDFGYDKVLVVFKGDYGYELLDKGESIKVTKGLIDFYKSGKLKEKYNLWKKQKKEALDNFKYLDSLNLKDLDNKNI